MGAVYRATDTKLGRDVAIKVLPDELANDPERLARFDREAKVLASLNNPNIAAIYGLEERAVPSRAATSGGQVLNYDLPQNIEVDALVSMNQPVAQAHDLRPRNIRMHCLPFGCDAAGGLAGNLQQADQREVEHPVRFQAGPAPPACHGDSFFCMLQHMNEPELILMERHRQERLRRPPVRGNGG